MFQIVQFFPQRGGLFWDSSVKFVAPKKRSKSLKNFYFAFFTFLKYF